MRGPSFTPSPRCFCFSGDAAPPHLQGLAEAAGGLAEAVVVQPAVRLDTRYGGVQRQHGVAGQLFGPTVSR